ncbi:Leo1-like protein, partial [Opisthorchis viverrini]
MEFDGSEDEADNASGGERGENQEAEDRDGSSEFDSFSEEEEEEPHNVVTQKDVFGSDTESEGHASPRQGTSPTKSRNKEDGSSSKPAPPIDEELSDQSDLESHSDRSASPEVQPASPEVQSSVDEDVEEEEDRQPRHIPSTSSSRMPNFLSVETRPFDPNFYEDELDEDEVLDEEGRTRLKLKVENTIRWRVAKTDAGDVVHESNARIVRWSDGSLSLHLGDEIFDIHKVDIHADYNYLFIREGSGLQGQSSLRTKLTFRPHSTDSFTHRKITLSLADKTNKSQKVKILPVAGADPESNRIALVKREEEKLRVTLRRESRMRRLRERQAMTRGSFGGGSSSSHRHYGGDEDDDEDDGNSTSINALKRNAKNALAASRKDVAAIYSSESDSLSDISEPRKKVRARISDEDDSA